MTDLAKQIQIVTPLTSPDRASAFDPITELTRTLSLVRPIGMSDDMAGDWLVAAAAEVMHLPRNVLEAAASEARKACTHHGQIIPAILASQAVKTMNASKALDWDRNTQAPRLAAPVWTPDESEIEQIKREAAERLSAAR